MTPLDLDAARLFRDRFYSFDDGILRSIDVRVQEGAGLSVVVLIATQDTTRPVEDRWVCVRLVVSRVQSFCFADANSADDGRTYSGVLSHGMHVCWFGDTIGLEFGECWDPPKDLAEMKVSKLYVAGGAVEWAVEAYC